jgi:hypothetical protein
MMGMLVGRGRFCSESRTAESTVHRYLSQIRVLPAPVFAALFPLSHTHASLKVGEETNHAGKLTPTGREVGLLGKSPFSE